MINTAPVVPFRGLNPNCMLLTVISFLSLRSRIFSNIFIPSSNSLVPLKFLHSSGSPLSTKISILNNKLINKRVIFLKWFFDKTQYNRIYNIY